jgi:tetratricopeptide (TPR) repeat protein
MGTAGKPLLGHARKFISILVVSLSCVTPWDAMAVQWQPLARTSRYDVAIDTGSMRLTNLSRLAVWLRFTPLDDLQRRQAAAEYGQKAYRLHLEYYEIDCSEQSAVLGMVEILGPSRKQLGRLKSSGPPEVIIPGSALDLSARKVCPALEENSVSEEDDSEVPDSDSPTLEAQEKQIPEESRQAIELALNKTENDSKDLEAWRELGNAYYDADMTAQAIAAYDRALAIKPDDTNILNDQGAMYRQSGDFTRALANFEKARAVDRYNLESLYNIGYVLAFDLNQIDKAIVVWRGYLVLDKTSETSRQVQSFIERYSTSAGVSSRK